jgi:hypothetical protein
MKTVGVLISSVPYGPAQNGSEAPIAAREADRKVISRQFRQGSLGCQALTGEKN